MFWYNPFSLISDKTNPRKRCDYIPYFEHQDRDGLGPTDAILSKYFLLFVSLGIEFALLCIKIYDSLYVMRQH